jgi:hypothetical protein
VANRESPALPVSSFILNSAEPCHGCSGETGAVWLTALLAGRKSTIAIMLIRCKGKICFESQGIYTRASPIGEPRRLWALLAQILQSSEIIHDSDPCMDVSAHQSAVLQRVVGFAFHMSIRIA